MNHRSHKRLPNTDPPPSDGNLFVSYDSERPPPRKTRYRERVASPIGTERAFCATTAAPHDLLSGFKPDD